MRLLKAILLNNIFIKIISLVLAVLTWAYIAGELYKEKAETEKEAPSIIKVSGEKLIVKRLPIYVNLEGSAAEGYRVVLDKIAIDPSYSVVAGPPEIIKELTYITTEPISIEGAHSTVRTKSAISKIPNCKIGYGGPVSVSIPVARVRRR